MGNDIPSHLSPNLNFNLQIKMRMRSEMGPLNIPQVPLIAAYWSVVLALLFAQLCALVTLGLILGVLFVLMGGNSIE